MEHDNQKRVTPLDQQSA